MTKPILGLSLQVSMPICVHDAGVCASANCVVGPQKTAMSNADCANVLTYEFITFSFVRALAGTELEFSRRDQNDYLLPNGKMVFQSFFMSTTVQPSAWATSRALSSRPIEDVRS